MTVVASYKYNNCNRKWKKRVCAGDDMYANLNKRFLDKYQNKKVQQTWGMRKYLNNET